MFSFEQAHLLCGLPDTNGYTALDASVTFKLMCTDLSQALCFACTHHCSDTLRVDRAVNNSVNDYLPEISN